MKIRKAIIPAAGLGARFLPATKAQPKEMLPIVDKPSIQYVVEEAVASGIEEILIIIGRGKESIENHFDKSYELEDALLRQDKLTILSEIRNISNLGKIYYVRQKEPKGLGHAVLCAKNFIGDEPFAVLLGDDIIMSETPCLQQLMTVFENYHSSVLAVQSVSEDEVSKYGIIKPIRKVQESNVFQIGYLVEKPKRDEAPSNLAIMGRYILGPEIFEILEKTPIGFGSELQLTDAINELNKRQAVLAVTFKGRRYDIGDKLGFIKANIDYALQRDDIRREVMDYLRELNKIDKLQVNKDSD